MRNIYFFSGAAVQRPFCAIECCQKCHTETHFLSLKIYKMVCQSYLFGVGLVDLVNLCHEVFFVRDTYDVIPPCNEWYCARHFGTKSVII